MGGRLPSAAGAILRLGSEMMVVDCETMVLVLLLLLLVPVGAVDLQLGRALLWELGADKGHVARS